eukprot:15064341-Alexandrium_andersonii.AAC.1
MRCAPSNGFTAGATPRSWLSVIGTAPLRTGRFRRPSLAGWFAPATRASRASPPPTADASLTS